LIFSVLELCVDIEAAQQSLESIELTGNTLSAAAAEAISHKLALCPNMKHAHLSDIFTGRGTVDVYPALVAKSYRAFDCNLCYMASFMMKVFIQVFIIAA
jgi:Ran GTPase-activating protein (RanGAP) involved in mRNA processing and transport